MSASTLQMDEAKRLATLKARCALQGVVLHVTDDDSGRPLFIAVRWALTAAFSNLDDLAAWVGRVDGLSE